ncbi:MAG TPA: TonB-dependent receptor [Bryobacteraceae bacterium]|nr:TonB-dependent receptor [Bryobacteraceae bacterium]
MLIGSAAVLCAQGGYAVVSGIVRDASNAVVPGATLTARNINTDVTVTSASNAVGYYTFTTLAPGTYIFAAKQPSFKLSERNGVVLQVGDHLELDFALEIGEASQHVTVTGQPSQLRVDDAQSGMVIDNHRIQQLPAYDRNVLSFATLVANVNGTSEQEGQSTDFRINGGRSAQAEYYIDGVAVTTSYQHNVPPSVPSMEAVEEFNVVTNGLSAEYGRLSGGAVVLVTRSGTNQFHGSAYEYLRNQDLNANTWSANRYGQKIGVFHDNVFGAALGGPIRIPKLYNGRDKTFFFFNYEGTRHVSGSNATLAGVPTALERQGDFSQSLIGNGTPVVVYDPASGVTTSTGDVTRSPFPGNIVPANRWDSLSKLYLSYYPLPNTAPLPGSSDANNYVGASLNPQSDDRWTGRLDHNWNASNSTHFTLTRDDYKNLTPAWLSPLQPSTVAYGTSVTAALSHVWTISPTTVLEFRAGVVRLDSYSQQQVSANTANFNLPSLVLSLLGTSQNRVPSLSTGGNVATLGGGGVDNIFETNANVQISFTKILGKHTAKVGFEHRRYYTNLYGAFNSNVGNFTTGSAQSGTSQSYLNPGLSGYGFASWLLGEVNQASGNQYGGPASLQTYWAAYAEDSYKVSSKLTLTYGLRWDFEPPRSERFDRQYYWDQNYKWQLSPDAGWNWNQVVQQAGLNPATTPTPLWMTNGILGRLALVNTADYPGTQSQASHPDHFSPRVGVAYQLTHRMVLRGSYGVNWLTTTGNQLLDSADRNVGFGSVAHISSGTGNNGLTYISTFSNPMPNGFGYVSPTTNMNALNYQIEGQWLDAPAYNIEPGYEQMASLGIQHEFGSNENSWVAEVRYNGNFGRMLPVWLGFGQHILPNAYNILSPLGNALNAQVPNPFYGQVPAGTPTGSPMISLGRLYQLNPLYEEVWTSGGSYSNSATDAAGLTTWGTSNYNALTASIEHRFGNGFAFLANYTFSKLLQDTGSIGNGQPQGVGEQAQPQAGLGLGDVYSIAPSDFTHKFLFNYSLDLPFGRGKRFLGTAPSVVDKVIGGWRLAGTTTFRSGQPIQVYTPSGGVGGLGSAWYNIGQGRNQRPVIVSGQQPGLTTDGHSALVGSPNLQYYVNPAAFALPNGFQLGNVPSTYGNWFGPGFSQWDMALMKEFGLGKETRRLQLRFEAQNAFNHMNAANPVSGINASGFGTIIAQFGNPRQAMVAAKLYF